MTARSVRSARSPRRRTVVALAVVLAVLAGFIVRLVDIQVVNADDHIADSVANALGSSRTLYGTRGSIVDEEGETLAGSILLYDGVLDPLNISGYEEDGGFLRDDGGDEPVRVSWEQASAEMAEITGQDPADIRQAVADALADDPESQFAYLERRLTTEQYRDLVAIGAPYLTFDQHPSRTYPDGAVGGNLVGFMGSEGALAGLELTEDACLSATDGTVSYQRGKDGVVIPGTEVTQPAEDGGTLQLTINRDLQWYMQQLIAEQTQAMRADSGAIMVVEVATGKIRAAAEYPTVDPNDVTASEPEDRASRIFTNWFEPGSTFKPLTAATLIDAAGQKPTSTVTVSSTETFANGARVRDAFSHPAYEYTLTGVLIDSSNAGIAKFSERASAQTRYEYLKEFGIGDGSAVGFLGEQSGLIYPADQWDAQTTYNTAFGQGLTTTMPELAGAYTAIANDGVRVPLSLVESCTSADGTVTTPELPEPTRVISEKTSKQVRAMLENVFLQANYADAVEIPGYRVAGKTGTGEKSNGNGGYKVGAYYTTMLGFAPADDPEYLVIVTLDEPTKVKSSAANATAFQRAMTQVLKTYRVMPATTAPEELPKFG
ncbi:peptidoglycan D,D-transpeptidase FtsI family protein [Microbacterium thalassium]|uniref:Cell division protein FtsI (Penicillin-binding protein 3) n=1 Tax=Microbacterium thalassium TaxID=362649 RepID=A0A7X0FQ70_9MICO|nr:penicillin-binding protein 2 [Microbacterium thalassium]MBB6391670.1 cell division protein FtsI (penicillin-binding protein 3) [Microbacterium thalassium]GLK24273.1 cell division protein FtsI [Microbacterium thalassium]